MNHHRIKQLFALCKLQLLRQKALRARLWWLAFCYPMALVLTLFLALTSLIYSGKASSRLSALAEGKLLEISLISSRRAPTGSLVDGIIVVNAVPIEQQQFNQAPRGRHPDFAVDAYAKIIAKLIDAGVEHIFVAWNLTSHRTNPSYYQSLIEVAKQAPSSVKISLVVDPEQVQLLPSDLLAHIKILHDIRCRDRADREIFCPYLPEQKNWIHTRLIELSTELAPVRANRSKPKAWLTDILPSNTVSFALALPPRENLQHSTFAELIAGKKVPEATIAFVGSDASFATSGSISAPFVRTIFDTENYHFDVAGTPSHLYWAQLATMLVDGPYIQFPPPWLIHLSSICLVSVILLVMLTKTGTLAASILIYYAIIVLAFNLTLTTSTGWYLPLFDSVYFGLAVLCFAGAGRLSYLSYAQWQLQESENIHSKTLDLKNNFISLVSHNLNTPIAKMQSMLAIVHGIAQASPAAETAHKFDLLANCEKNAPHLVRLDHTRRLVTQLELLVRLVLHSLALEEGKTVETTRSIDSLIKEFTNENASLLKKLGIVLKPRFISNDPDLLAMPVKLDPKLTKTAIVALAILALLPQSADTYPHREQIGELRIQLTDNIDQQQLTVEFAVIPALSQNSEALAPQTQSLLSELAETWLAQFAQAYTGKVSNINSDKKYLGQHRLEVHWFY